MAGQEATESMSKIASKLNNLELTKAKPNGKGGEPHGKDHYCAGNHGGQKSQS